MKHFCSSNFINMAMKENVDAAPKNVHIRGACSLIACFVH